MDILKSYDKCIEQLRKDANYCDDTLIKKLLKEREELIIKTKMQQTISKAGEVSRGEVMDYVTGQIYGWNGGECPVHPKTEVNAWFRIGVGSLTRLDSEAGLCSWDHSDDDLDIVCFQVITPYVEPKTIWVNEYRGGAIFAYASEETARSYVERGQTRIAVKYVEVK